MIKVPPSTLSFLWNDCPRCFHLQYTAGIRQPGVFPQILNQVHNIIADATMGMNIQELIPGAKPGRVMGKAGTEKSVESKPVGDCYISGRLDKLIQFDDGTVGIFDTKTTNNIERHASKYSYQLNAYAHALENPAKGSPVDVSELWLLGVFLKDWGALVEALTNVWVKGSSDPRIYFTNIDALKAVFDITPYRVEKFNIEPTLRKVSDIVKEETIYPTPSCQYCQRDAWMMDHPQERQGELF